MAEKSKQQLADIEKDFTQWYTDVVLKTGLCDYGPLKGTMVIRPYGYAMWETLQEEFNKRFKALGVKNAYFPMLIPYSYLMREAEHVEGFAPEVALVTHVGETELAEKLVVRPTSETIICDMFSKWVQSYRDLPLKINQWANIVRWEKTTRPFLRTSEFLWQEGHTVHSSGEEADAFALEILKVYEEFCKNVLALPVLCGRKSEKEKFAGAVATYSIEAMMKDGKSLQAGTTHYLGDNFAKAFDIKFLDKDGTHKYAYTSSWGVSTRLIGALIMAHGDANGLALPPRIAPIQAIVVPIAAQKPGVIEAAQKLADSLAKSGVRAECDARDLSPGFKFNDWELKGVPVRVEIGPRDIENNACVLCRRDTGEKIPTSLDGIEKAVAELLDEVHGNMYDTAAKHLASHTVDVADLKQMEKALDDGCFTNALWCGERSCEDEVKAKLQASTRNMPFEQANVKGKCVCCGKPAKKRIIFARAY